MKRMLLAFLLIGGLVFACTELAENSGDPTSPPPNLELNLCVCAETAKCQQLCSTLPNYVNGHLSNDYLGSLDSINQTPFDQFSWQSFIALNWPAGSNGQPLNTPIGSAPDSFRVWEQYLDIANVFNNTLFGSSCEPSGPENIKLFLFQKTPRLVNPDGSFQEADGNALLDRNLNFALYDIRLNDEEVSYILSNNLNTKSGQENFTGEVDFPLASMTLPDSVGAIEIKAAWRILDESKGDDLSRYYHRKATIYIPGEYVKDGNALCVEETVGLVGFHIARKVQTKNLSQVDHWIWSTFEHVDNTPNNPIAAQDPSVDSTHYSFYKPNCINCPVNSPPSMSDSTGMCFGVDNPQPTKPRAVKWARQQPYGEDYGMCIEGDQNAGERFGTQVIREYPIFQYTQGINQFFQSKLAGTVWENYQLIGTQWRRNPFENFTTTTDIPYFLANAVQETFMQPNASCAACHAGATIEAKSGKISADHSFVLGRAQ